VLHGSFAPLALVVAGLGACGCTPSRRGPATEDLAPGRSLDASTPSSQAPRASAEVHDASEAAPTYATTADPDGSVSCLPGMQVPDEHALKLAQGPCRSNADCVLTDAPMGCNACNFARLYPALRTAVGQRNALCKLGSCAQCCTPTHCPPRDLDTGAFYRPECRDNRCIAWRYHSGG
jgi:hypothetical protein